MPVFSKVFWVPLSSAFGLFALKKQVKNIAKPILMIIGKDQNDKEMLNARVLKASALFYKMIFYTAMSLWAYYILKDSEIYPSWLGGKGSLKNCFVNYPYSPQVPGLLTYSLV